MSQKQVGSNVEYFCAPSGGFMNSVLGAKIMEIICYSIAAAAIFVSFCAFFMGISSVQCAAHQEAPTPVLSASEVKIKVPNKEGEWFCLTLPDGESFFRQEVNGVYRQWYDSDGTTIGMPMFGLDRNDLDAISLSISLGSAARVGSRSSH